MTAQQPTPTKTAKFVLSGWDYPDAYGQGIEVVYAYTNDTGSWVKVKDPAFFLPDDETAVSVNATLSSTAMKFIIYANINHTLHDLTDNMTAYTMMRVSMEMSGYGTEYSNSSLGTNGINFDDTPTTWQIGFEIIPPVILVVGRTYTVTINYELYIPSEDEPVLMTATSGSTDAQTPTGDYTDTHSVNSVYFGGTDPAEMSVFLWVELSEEIEGFDYAIYWNSLVDGDIYIYDHDASDWVLLDGSPNGGGSGPLAWDNDTVSNEDYYNSTHVGFSLYCGIVDGAGINVDYFEIVATPAPEWTEINEATLYFRVSYPPEQVFLGNLVLIALGMIMVPVSTMYLVKGGRDELSTDKGFWFIIIFMLGWAFIIGGVMP